MNAMLMFPLMINGMEWVIIALVILLLFGGKRIPELMKGLGKGVKEFKSGMKEAENELKDIKKELNSDEEPKKEE
ncbi:MAG: twin-arginine translocase TatA/TatE family subunit [Bacteroidales bacterium]|nr:twin-arginine translocase TatA/TatE family subunit [Candidatus Cryptobacteroides caccocaballi]